MEATVAADATKNAAILATNNATCFAAFFKPMDKVLVITDHIAVAPEAAV